MSITFKVDEIRENPNHRFIEMEPNSKRIEQLKLWAAAVRARWSTKLGIVQQLDGLKLNTTNQVALADPNTNWFVKTAISAFRSHKPIAFSPEDIWLVILQAMSRHIALNAEACKAALGVTWDDQKELTVVNDDFVKGSQDNNWEREFGRFGDQIERHLGKQRKLFDATFTTTTPTTQAAITVQMMSALAPYFKYGMMTYCGVPTVTLLGTTDDWADILTRVNAIGEWYPAWALGPLQTAVGNFVSASAGRADVSFWQHFFKTPGGSGGTPVNGWINAFFPYVESARDQIMKPNKLMTDPQKTFSDHVRTNTHAGYQVGAFGSSIASVPMDWNYYGKRYDMKLITGIMGQTEVDGEVRPVIGYAIGESTGKTPAEADDNW